MLVKGFGPTNSPPLAIIGEAPGRDEEAQGKPFVGPSGWLLTQMLSEAGIDRNECYITNVCQRRPPNNDFSFFYTDKTRKAPSAELVEERGRLWKELRDVNPKVIVTMGNEPLLALTQEKGIKKWRGTMIEKHEIRVMPTWHPAYVMRVYKERPVVELDLKKAYRQAHKPSWPTIRIQSDPTFEACMAFLETRPERCVVDIETIQLHTRCIGFAWSPEDAISIPLMSRGSSLWTTDQEAQLLMAIDIFLRDPKIKFIYQNGPFDLTVMAKELGLHTENYYMDTMFGHHLLYPELPKNLDFLSSLHTDFPHYSDYDASSDESTQTYNGMDCLATFQVADAVEAELKERNMWTFYRETLHPVVTALTRMQNRGVLIDMDLRAEIDTRTETELAELLTTVQSLTHEDFNPSSPKQVKELIYETLKLPKQYKPQTKEVTSDGDALKALSKRYPVYAQTLSGITRYREKRTFLGTFVRAKVTKDNRIKTSYNPAGTVTGRISSSQTIDGFGGNLQNIPRGQFRRIYKADPGKILIKADLAQAEYRYLIWLARIERIIDKFLHDPSFSIHYWNASNIYNKPRPEITKEEYDNAKNGVYGANYGIGPLKVARMYDMDFRQAKLIIENYHHHVPEIRSVFQREIRQQILETRMLRNPFGRERLFFGRVDDEMYRKAYSHSCQSTIADLIYYAVVELDDLGVELLLQVHDELVLQCPVNDLDATCKIVKRAMEREIKVPGVEAPLIIPVEIQVGDNWYDVRQYEEST